MITTFSPNLAIKLVLSGTSLLAIGTFLGPIILSDEKFENIYNRCIHSGFLCFGHITSADIDSQLYKLCVTQ